MICLGIVRTRVRIVTCLYENKQESKGGKDASLLPYVGYLKGGSQHRLQSSFCRDTTSLHAGVQAREDSGQALAPPFSVQLRWCREEGNLIVEDTRV